MADIDPRLLRAFERVVPGVAGSLSATADMESVPRWDSLTYVQIMASIETEFDVTLTTLEAARMRSVPAICAVLAEHGVGIDGSAAAQPGPAPRAHPEHLPPRRDGATDPMPQLIERGDATPVGHGRFAYAGQLLTLIERIDRALATLAIEMGAEPRAYPATLPTASLIDAGYLHSFPHQVYFAGIAAPDTLASVAAATRPEQIAIESPALVLAPTVCHHSMEALRGRKLNGSLLLTAANPCHRHEREAHGDLSRLQAFRMRELVQYGSTDQVSAMLDEALANTLELLRDWDIAFRVADATDPFFAGAMADKSRFQSLLGLKRELLVRVDHSDEWIAVASFNDHLNSLVEAFDIGVPRSGCAAWGLERFAYALMSRHGAGPENWPDGLA